MAIYMKVDGVTGDVQEAGHTGWIQLSQMNWGVGRGIGSPKSGAKDREASEAHLSEISVQKISCGVTPDLMRLALWGKAKKVQIEITKTGDNNSQTAFHKYELEDVLFSSYSNESTGDRPAESLSLNFTKITFSNVPSDDTHKDADANRFQYDLATGKGS
ncbi:MAG TPA: type VI secretion system tube protein Hcp [Gemmataceae bacterium]|nr:type VI secretion system tube protein Hcp [Gemmataceae bacterium]